MSDRYVIPSLDRAIRILDLLADEHRAMSLSELTRASDIPKSTLFRILVTLRKHHCVVTEPDSNNYRLGSHLWELGNAFADQTDLFRTSKRYMEDLAHACNETVFLSKLEDGEVVYLRRMESPKSITAVRKLESRVPAHCTATGVALMAWLPEDEVDAILNQHGMTAYNEATLTDRQALKQRLAEVRQRQYAVVDGEYNSELLCVAAPVFDHDGHPRAALTVAMLSAQVESPERIEEVGTTVRRVAHDLSRDLGGRNGNGSENGTA
jgi:IclR family acetate operon transcriptional repressor